MLKASFLGLDLLEKKTFFKEAVRYYLAIFYSIKGVSLRGTSQSFWKKKTLLDVNLYLPRFQGMKLEAIVVEEEMTR